MLASPSELADYWQNGQALLRAHWYLRTATLGSRVRVWGQPHIRNQGTLVVGPRVRLMSVVAKLEIGVGPEGRLEIGEGTFINHGTSIAATESVSIGPYCNIGTYVLIMDNDFHRIEPERRNEWPESAPIIIEENVWLGAKAVVLRGVTIGGGSVVGAGSVVVNDIPARSLAVGVPARVVRKL